MLKLERTLRGCGRDWLLGLELELASEPKVNDLLADRVCPELRGCSLELLDDVLDDCGKTAAFGVVAVGVTHPV